MSGATTATALTAADTAFLASATAASGVTAASTVGAAAASFLPSLSTLGMIASGVSAIGSLASGRANSASAKYNSEVASNNAKISAQNAAFAGAEGAANTAIEQQKTRANIGAIKATQAAHGIDVNSGSAVDVRSSAEELGQLNAISIRSNAAREAYKYQTQSASDTGQAQLDKEQAKYASEAGDVNAATTLLSSGVQGRNSGLWDNQIAKNSLDGDF